MKINKIQSISLIIAVVFLILPIGVHNTNMLISIMIILLNAIIEMIG